MLAKIRHYVNSQTLRSIYFAIFSSHLTYGSQIWAQKITLPWKKLSRYRNVLLELLPFLPFVLLLLPFSVISTSHSFMTLFIPTIVHLSSTIFITVCPYLYLIYSLKHQMSIIMLLETMITKNFMFLVYLLQNLA